MSEQQPVTETPDAQSATVTEGGGAPEPSVDDLLKQFDDKPSPEPPAETPDKDDRLDVVYDYVERKATEERLENTNTDIKDAVKVVTGDRKLDPEYVEGKLHYEANTNPRFRNAWLSRHENPAAYQQVLKAYGKELAAKSNIDQPVTEDRAALSAAVRSQSTKPAEPPPSAGDIRKMSDAEFNRMKRELRGR